MNNCPVCGNPITRKSKFKPFQYCSDNCKDFSKYFEAMEKRLLLVKPTKEARKMLRGQLFGLSNSISICTITKDDKC